MADWQFKLDFKDFWHDEIAVFDRSAKVVDRIKELLPTIRERAKGLERFKAWKQLKNTLEDMADKLENDVLPMFEELVEMKSENVEDFDNALSYLYDWADSPLDNNWGGKKMCWVSTVI